MAVDDMSWIAGWYNKKMMPCRQEPWPTILEHNYIHYKLPIVLWIYKLFARWYQTQKHTQSTKQRRWICTISAYNQSKGKIDTS